MSEKSLILFQPSGLPGFYPAKILNKKSCDSILFNLKPQADFINLNFPVQINLLTNSC